MLLNTSVTGVTMKFNHEPGLVDMSFLEHSTKMNLPEVTILSSHYFAINLFMTSNYCIKSDSSN